MTVKVHSAYAQTCRLAVRAGHFPISGIGNVEMMILAERIIHTQSVVVFDAKRLLPSFVIIAYALIAQGMIGYVRRLNV